MSVFFRKEPNGYYVYVGERGKGVLIGAVTYHAGEWIATDPNGSWVTTTDTRRAAGEALAKAV